MLFRAGFKSGGTEFTVTAVQVSRPLFLPPSVCLSVCLSLCLSVYLFVRPQDYSKSYGRI